MGRTPKPLYIVMDPEIVAWEEVQILGDQGHSIVRPDSTALEWGKVDLILSSKAWRMDTAHRKYLPLAIAAGRAHRYPKEK